MQIYYTVYKITNNITGEYYVGCHQTENLNDSYMGSGKLLREAIEEYGIENFSKEYLGVFDNPDKMFEMEAKLVNHKDNTAYNVKRGGKGGWDYCHENELNKNIQEQDFDKDASSKKGRDRIAELRKDPEWQKWYSERVKAGLRKRKK